MHLGRSARCLLLVAFLGACVAGGIWFFGRGEEEVLETEFEPETEAHRQVRKAVLHNVGRPLVDEVLRIEAEERRVAETVWAKEMLAQECGRTIERLCDEINGATNKLTATVKATA